MFLLLLLVRHRADAAFPAYKVCNNLLIPSMHAHVLLCSRLQVRVEQALPLQIAILAMVWATLLQTCRLLRLGNEVLYF